MHEFILIVLNILFFGYTIKYIFKKNIKIAVFISFIIIWILFLNVNPYEYNQTKLSILSYIPAEYIPKMSMLKYTNINNLQYPVIFKPIKCARNGSNVVIINNLSDATTYLQHNNINEIMVQTFIPYKNEIGILYEKNIKSMIIKYSKDSSIYDGSCYGYNSKCKDITNLVTPELNNVIKNISNHIPNFNVGRYDIKYKDLNLLLKGTDFYVLEANGTMGFDLRKNKLDYFGIKSIYYLERWFIYRQLQGLKNIITLNGYNPIKLIKTMVITIYNTIVCMDWEKLFAIYS
jgi:hypothetical protein